MKCSYFCFIPITSDFGFSVTFPIIYVTDYIQRFSVGPRFDKLILGKVRKSEISFTFESVLKTYKNNPTLKRRVFS